MVLSMHQCSWLWCVVIQVLLDGVVVYTATNIASQAYTHYSAAYTPESTSMTLTLLGRDDTGGLHVDDVSVCKCLML